ncbi:MAG: class I SAM-dependent methyltransferase [Nanoarchaeota archaeon]|nr:class I SAM-dependent methyltransferase [Nanoarchaeota archaeon]
MAVSIEDVVYHLSSSKTKPNKIMKAKILPFLQEKQVRTVLDYGCGKFLRDSLFLAEQGFKVDAVDLEEQVERIDVEKVKKVNNVSTEILRNNYDAAMLNFVIQVLPTEKQRQEVFKKVYNAIKESGYFILSLRNSYDINKYVRPKGIPFKDGYLMKKSNTFVKAYEREEIQEMLNSLKLNIIKIHKTCDSYISISQK